MGSSKPMIQVYSVSYFFIDNKLWNLDVNKYSDVENINRKLSEKLQLNSEITLNLIPPPKLIQQGSNMIIWSNLTWMYTFCVDYRQGDSLMEWTLTRLDVGCKQSLVKFKPTVTKSPLSFSTINVYPLYALTERGPNVTVQTEQLK